MGLIFFLVFAPSSLNLSVFLIRLSLPSVSLFIASLYEFRKQFLDDKEKLFESFISAWEQRAKWEAGTLHPDDSQTATMPNAKETMAEMMIGTYMMDRYRKMTDKSRKNWKYFRKS